ncbi:T9SS type A sorting domain-containing protein, partial [bacterium]|nr:T9SS type A sorting domain-containing protein [bacterium]
PGNTHALLNATNNVWFIDSAIETTTADLLDTTYIWTSLDAYSDPDDEPRVDVADPDSISFADCGEASSGRQGVGSYWSAISAEPEANPAAVRDAVLPTVTVVGPPFPNPTRGVLTIDLAVSPDHAGRYRVHVYDVQGRLVTTLVDRPVDPGRYRLEGRIRSSSGHPVTPGVYFVRVSGPDVRQNSKLVVIR